MAQPSIIVYSASDVDKVPMLADNNTFTGNTTFQPSTNSIAAVAVNDKDGNNVLTVDTVNGNIGIGNAEPFVGLQIGTPDNSKDVWINSDSYGIYFGDVGLVYLFGSDTDLSITFENQTVMYIGSNRETQFNYSVRIPANDQFLYFGIGDKLSIGYDGTNGNIKMHNDFPADLHIGCGTDKTLVLDTPVYNDANVGSLVLQTGGTLPGIVQILEGDGGNSGIYTRGFAVGEEGSGVMELPHDYKEGTDITFHIHWGGNDAVAGGTDNVQWQLTYAVTRDGSAFPNASTTIVKESAITAQYLWLKSDFTAITGTNFKIGDQFHFSIKRIAASADEYGGEALVATIGFHYQCDTLGSRQIGTK